jgi:hypothetical protein
MLDWQSRYTPLVRVNLVYLKFGMRIKLERCDLLPNPAKNRRANQFGASGGEGSAIHCKRRQIPIPNPESRLAGATASVLISVFLYARARFYT